jgi:hypothetical protein
MLRFTIRDVLWLTVVVGLALGWWQEHRRSETRLPQPRKSFDVGRPFETDFDGAGKPVLLHARLALFPVTARRCSRGGPGARILDRR